jgi:hypothetical protein
MPEGSQVQKVAAAFLLLAALAACDQPKPEVSILPDASCRMPAVTWSIDDSKETVMEIRRLAAARAKLCGRRIK